MKLKTIGAQMLAVVMLGGVVLTPITASAQSRRDRENQHRQDKKNEWRNIAIGSGALGVLGLLSKNNTLMWSGVAGGLYSTYRYEQDRKSQSKAARERAALYGRSSITVDGKRYKRQTVWKNGQKHYKFVRN